MASLLVKTRQPSGWGERPGFSHAVGLALLLAASAFLMSLALRLDEARWVGWFTLLPLFLAIRVLSPLKALGAGAFWGLSLAALSAPGPESAIAPGIKSLALMALAPALYAALASRMTRRVGFHPLLLGLGWLGVELVLQPFAVRNGLLAATQGDGLAIRAIGHLGGYLCVAFLVAYVNASLLEMLVVACPVGSARPIMRVARDLIERATSNDTLVMVIQHGAPASPRAPPF